MNRIFAIDPGNKESAYAVVNILTRRPITFAKCDNETLLFQLGVEALRRPTLFTVEMVSSYGMPVGKDVFETVFWAGRFIQRIEERGAEWQLTYRSEVKLHHCRNRAAKDPNVIAALRDRFAPGVRNYGKGTKAEPGWFHGFSEDVWQAYALAVMLADRHDPDGVPAT